MEEEEMMRRGALVGASGSYPECGECNPHLRSQFPILAVVLVGILAFGGATAAGDPPTPSTTAPCPEYPDVSGLIEYLEGMQAQASGLDLEALRDAVTVLAATRVQRDALCARLDASGAKLEAYRESLAASTELLEGCRVDREEAWKELRARILKPACPSVGRFGWTAGGGPCYTAERGDLTVCAAVVWGLHF